MRNNVVKKVLAATLACMMTFSMTTVAQAKGDKKSDKEITIVVTSFADTLEPTEQYFSWVVSRYAIGECLTKFDENGEIVPCLAEEWENSDDGKTWTFKIREGVKFSNGDDMTPEMVKASIERTAEKSDRVPEFFDLDSLEVDGQNLIFHLNRANANMAGSLADPLFLIVDTNVDDSTFAMEGPICTGPYAVESFSPTDSCVVVKNENYWDGEVPLDRVTLKCVDDQTTRSMALQTGEIDIAYNLKTENLIEFEGNDNYEIQELQSLRSTYAFMNQSEGRALSDKALRQALLRGLDKQTYCDVLLEGGATAGKAPVPPTVITLLGEKIREAASVYPDRDFGRKQNKYLHELMEKAERRKEELEAENVQTLIYREEPFIYDCDSISFQVYLMIVRKGVWKQKIMVEKI